MPTQPRPPLSLTVLHPCARTWDSFEGDHRRRYCDDCNLHVHNASELTEDQARALLARPERVCMTGLARSDGRLLTRERLKEEARIHLRHRPLLRIAAALGLISIPTALMACNRGLVGVLSGDVRPPKPPQNTQPDTFTLSPPGEMSRPLPPPAPPYHPIDPHD